MDDKTKRKVQKYLNKIIEELHYGGSTDPGYSELESMTYAYLTLEALGLKIKDHKDVKSTLEGKNICEVNFLKNQK